MGFQLVKQHGKTLLRLEALEEQLAGLVAGSAGAARTNAAPRGLAPGTTAPEFELADLSGKSHTLAEMRGNPVLLISFSPQCGYCVQMGADLAALPVDGRDGAPIPLVITTGEAEQNRKLVEEHQIKCVVLLQKANEVVSKYDMYGTPMGYLIDAQGRIASAVAAGSEAILALARGAPQRGNGSAHKTHHGNRTLAQSRIKRDGLAAGSVAPDFTLPQLDGPELRLSDFRGRHVLLVFSDPQCGPCTEVLLRLEIFHRNHPDLLVLTVSRGDAEPNRRKACDLGLTFPVVLQRQWEISREYAMFTTPIAYLIDAKGTIAADVAVGIDAILGLANHAAATMVS